MSIRIVKYENVVDPRLGRIIEHDERSKQYPYKARQSVQLVSKRWPRLIPTFQQGNTGSCTGNSGVGCVGTAPFFTTVTAILASKNLTLDEKEAVAVYSAATAIDSFPGTYPPDDTGSSGLAVAKVLQGLGLISGYTHILSFADLLDALQEHPVIVGTDWYESMFTPDAKGIIVPDWKNLAGGHEYIIDEINVEAQLLGIQNSWGEEWGLQGRAYISFTDMKRLLSTDGDATAFVPINVPAPEPIPTPSPTPSPEPVPPVNNDADATLWQAVMPWAIKHHTGINKTAAKSVLDWAKQKGYTK